MADEAGSQPIGSGGCNFFSPLCCTPWGHALRPAVYPDERPVPSTRKEPGIHESFEQFVAKVPIKTPKSLRLSRRQAKTGHFYEFALHSPKRVLYAHEKLP